MRNIAALAVVAFAALILVMAHAGPAYTAQAATAVTNGGASVDSVVKTENAVPVQLIRGGGMHGGGARSFSSGHVSSFSSGHVSSFSSGHVSSFHSGHHRHFRHFSPFFFGSVYAPYYSSYYYDNNCVWDGDTWTCYSDNY
jgi:hypothetical protein